MSIDRNQLKKLLSGLSKEDKKTFLDELGEPISKADDSDILDALNGLTGRVEALEKGLTPSKQDDLDTKKGKKKEKGFLDSLGDLMNIKGD